MNMMKQFRLSEALKTIYSLIWDDFCSWYLEWVKPGFEQPIEAAVYEKTVSFFEELMQLLHPFMPFITEEIYHLLKEQNDDLCVKQFNNTGNKLILDISKGELLKQVIQHLRDARNKNQLKPKETIKLHIQTSKNSYRCTRVSSLSWQTGKCRSIVFTKATVANTIVVVVGKDKFYIETERQLDTATLK